jgi:hypothetical protein
MLGHPALQPQRQGHDQGTGRPAAGTPIQKITIKRRVSCTKNVVVKSLRPDSRGRFSITLGGPPSGQAAVYRLATKVRKNHKNRKLFPTFTLPRAVALKR